MDRWSALGNLFSHGPEPTRTRMELVIIALVFAFLLPGISAFSSRGGSLSSVWNVNANWHSLKAKQTTYDDTLYGPFEEGDIGISRYDDTKEFFSLYYRVYNVDKPTSKTPLAILHGGPSLPSQYLYPLVLHLKRDRPVLFYDQLGCGRSDEPNSINFYSIAQSLNDLDTVLETLGYDKVHLFGHSYGGCLAYEYAQKRPQRIQSLILSNAPTNMKKSGDAYDRLASRNPLGFWKERVCSVQNPALEDAFQHVGRVWAGIDVVLDWVATPMAGSTTPHSTLIVSCRNDFVFEASRDWKSILDESNNVEEVILENCAHYPHLEDGERFGRVLDGFLYENDG